MKYGIVLLLTLSLFLGISLQVVASGDDFTPTFAKGEHTAWDEDLDDYGTTYGYYARPTDYGWFTSISTTADYSRLMFVCYYNEEREEDGETVPDSINMAVRFQLNSLMPFSVDEFSVTVTIGENDEVEMSFFRREDNETLIETYVSGFDKSRTADTFTIGIGPFTFKHDYQGAV